MVWFPSPVFNLTFWTHGWKGPSDFVCLPFDTSFSPNWKLVTSLQWRVSVTVITVCYFWTPTHLSPARSFSKRCCHSPPCSWEELMVLNGTVQQPGFLQNKPFSSEAPRLCLDFQVCIWHTIHVLHQKMRSSMNHPHKPTFVSYFKRHA